jgi:hypothetical protein
LRKLEFLAVADLIERRIYIMNSNTVTLLMGIIGGVLFWQLAITIALGFSSEGDKLPYYLAGGIFTLGLKLIFLVEHWFERLTYRKQIIFGRRIFKRRFKRRM